MNSSDSMPSIDITSDAELVSASLTGDRDAFGRIVERYQRLLCSLAYSATGQLSQSEDLAQEAFLESWRQLRTLREPEKLRPWLCGILRYKIGRMRRSDGREPVRQPTTVEVHEDLPSHDEPVADLVIQNEEQSILWSALARVPEIYREPLVLYYREHRSVEHVAAALDLTEDAVKQRLARGRKILQEQVLTFVEGALTRSTPGRVFTLGVLAALPDLMAPAKAVGIGTAAAKGGLLAKTTGIAALLSSLSGVVSAVLTLRANLDQARTPRERRAVVKATLAAFCGAWAFLAGMYVLRASAFRWWEYRTVFAGMTQALVVAGFIVWPVGLLAIMRHIRVLRSSERRAHPEQFLHPVDRVGSPAGEYKSRWRLLGVPLVHARFSSPEETDPPLFAWFAGGDRAYGLIAAWGGLAVAPFSVGAISVGIVSFGSVSLGLISMGTLACGGVVIGCAAIGIKAFAWLSALGWQTAQGGGFAIARVAAEGPIALAANANDPIAHAILANPNGDRNQMIFFIVASILSIVPVACYARTVRQRFGRQARGGGS